MPPARPPAGPRRHRPPRRRAGAGAVSVEFGLLLPVLALLGLAMSDVVNLFRAHLRVESTALQLGQLVSQCNAITAPGDTSQFWAYAQRVMGSTGAVTGPNASGAVIVSAVGRANNANQVAWQQRSGNPSLQSRVGTPGGTATLDGNFQVPQGQTLFVTEVFLPRETWVLAAGFMSNPGERVLRGTTMFLTRAPDAPALLQPPTASSQTNCTGNG